MVELTRQGVGFFKLDGVFGHLNLRNFELHGGKYGLPEMPQLGLEGGPGVLAGDGLGVKIVQPHDGLPELLVAGSAVYGTKDYAATVKAFRKACK